MERYEHEIVTRKATHADATYEACAHCFLVKNAECPVLLRKALDAALAERDALLEDIAEAKSYGVSEYAADVLRMLDAVKAPPRRRDSHGAIEDVEHRLRALAEERKAAEARAERAEALLRVAAGRRTQVDERFNDRTPTDVFRDAIVRLSLENEQMRETFQTENARWSDVLHEVGKQRDAALAAIAAIREHADSINPGMLEVLACKYPRRAAEKLLVHVAEARALLAPEAQR